MSRMKTMSPEQTGAGQTTSVQMSSVQLSVVAVGYVAVLVVSAALIYARHLQYVIHSADIDASGGMWAFGDWMLELFIAGLFLIPTLLLAFFVRKSETASTRYSQALLGIAITAPVCIGVLAIPAVAQGNSFFGWFCLGRISTSPVLLVGLVLSRLLARFKPAKRLLVYGLLVELSTYALLLAAVLLPWSKK
jgi:hypothetical protein